MEYSHTYGPHRHEAGRTPQGDVELWGTAEAGLRLAPVPYMLSLAGWGR